MTKVCSKCGEEKPATTEYFGKEKRNKDGLEGRCKDCRKECQNQWHKENKQYMKQWRQENKEHIKKYSKRYYEENAEHINQRAKQWRQENKEKMKEYWKQYRKENKEKIKERQKQYYKENTDSIRQRDQKRRASKERLPHALTLDQWQQIKDDFNNECAYCGKTEQEHKEEFNEQLHQEHFIPLSKGGGYTHNNIIPACRSCNSSKCDTDFFEWYPTYEYYNEEREQFILEYLGYIEDTQQLALDIEVV